MTPETSGVTLCIFPVSRLDICGAKARWKCPTCECRACDEHAAPEDGCFYCLGVRVTPEKRKVQS